MFRPSIALATVLLLALSTLSACGASEEETASINLWAKINKDRYRHEAEVADETGFQSNGLASQLPRPAEDHCAPDDPDDGH